MKHICGQNTTTTITGHRDKDKQPNAIDLRIDKVIQISNRDFVLLNGSKTHRGGDELQPYPTMIGDTGWMLSPGVYEIVMEADVHIGPNEAGWLMTRSTLIRNGLFIISGIYDSGYNGKVGGCLHVNGGRAFIAKGAPVAQFVLFDAEMLHQYNGSYGFGKQDDTKYGAKIDPL